MNIRYLDAADAEFQEAIEYYNDQQPGLGFEFADEVRGAVLRIANYPLLGHPCRSALAARRSIDFLTT